MPKKIIGIDLGTTNSCVAVMDGTEVKVIVNDDGKRTTPSVVAEKEVNGSLEIIVGQNAVRGSALNGKHTYSVTKRFMGRQMSEVSKEEKTNIGYELVTGTKGEVCINGKKKKLTPEEVAAHILTKLKNCAETSLGMEIDEAIITVPAYFNNAQREATKNAGEIAGLKVLRVINEPTAAALAYGFEKKQNGKILVYDLGGGTFDVSILSIDDGVIEVIATKGDMLLGGEDFDNAIVTTVVEDFKNQYGIDLKQNPTALGRIKEGAEEAKKVLSTSATTDINIPFIAQTPTNEPLHLNFTLTQAKFEQLVEKYVARTMKIVQEVLIDGKLEKKDIDEILLVGGQTRSKIIHKALKDYFNKEPNSSVNPDEAVAIGAAIQGGILSGEASVKDLLLLDVTPLSLGIETLGGVMTVLIPKNTTIPTQKSQVFSTAEDNQTSVTVAVFQGERSMARDNKHLGQFELSGIAPAKRGIPQVEISFSLNANGILEVSAKDKNTGKEHKITISNSGGLTKEEIEKMKADAEQNAEADEKRRMVIEVKNQLEQSIYSAEKNLTEYQDKISKELQTELRENIEKAKTALKDHSEDKEKLEEHSGILQASISKIGEEMSKQQPASEEAKYRHSDTEQNTDKYSQENNNQDEEVK